MNSVSYKSIRIFDLNTPQFLTIIRNQIISAFYLWLSNIPTSSNKAQFNNLLTDISFLVRIHT